MASASCFVIVGGGAAGFFAAIACAARTDRKVILLEAGPRFLSKVRISGGGRCNVTNVRTDPRELAEWYPRGGRALISPFHRFGPRETVAWFAERGVRLHAEPDGRMFPVTNSSATVIDCLMSEAAAAGVELRAHCGVRAVRMEEEEFRLELTDDTEIACDRLCVAMGGVRVAAAGRWIESLGHKLEPPVPSLFTFHVPTEWLRELPGISLEDVEIVIPELKRRERGPVLITHWGFSGPAILRLSAWGARELHDLDYQFSLRVNWLPGRTAQDVLGEFQSRRNSAPGKSVAKHPMAPLPSRLWEQLVRLAGIAPDTRWAILPKDAAVKLAELLTRTELPVSGKSLNKEEFVTCGGVRLREVDFKTMESRIRPGLHFAGEVLDVDGVTGGFNFQAAWTTGWIAGNAMAER